MIRRYRHFHEFTAFAVWLIVFLIVIPSAHAQVKYHLSISGLEDIYKVKNREIDSSAVDIEINKITQSLRAKGYWLSALDTSVVSNDTLYLSFFLGRKFDDIQIQFKGDSTVTKIGKWDGHHALTNDLNRLNRFVEHVLSQYENNGYPFVKVRVDSAIIDQESLHLLVDIDPGMLITFDSLKITRDDLLSDRFAANFLGLGVSKPYDEKAIQEIPQRLDELDFVRLKDVNVTYQLKQAEVTLVLEKIPANYFDGILGMIPDPKGGVQFTGELNLSLKNLFKSAKQLEIHWEKLSPESQKLNASYLHPMLLGSPLDLYLSYDQLKQDTSFSNRSLHLAFEYRPRPKLKMKVRYENKLGNQLSTTFADGGDFDIDYYGVGVTFLDLDNRKIPTQGWMGKVDASIGQKDITSLNSPPNSTQYDLMSMLRFYHRLLPRVVLHLETSGGLLFNDYLYLNDLYRLGGLQTIRGFNEAEFFASRYFLSRLECRYLLDERSFLVAFYDQAFMDYEIITGSYSDSPAGLGVGMQMAIKGGNFQVLYGLGKRNGETFSFDSSKIHFGYRALF